MSIIFYHFSIIFYHFPVIFYHFPVIFQHFPWRTHGNSIAPYRRRSWRSPAPGSSSWSWTWPSEGIPEVPSSHGPWLPEKKHEKPPDFSLVKNKKSGWMVMNSVGFLSNGWSNGFGQMVDLMFFEMVDLMFFGELMLVCIFNFSANLHPGIRTIEISMLTTLSTIVCAYSIFVWLFFIQKSPCPNSYAKLLGGFKLVSFVFFHENMQSP